MQGGIKVRPLLVLLLSYAAVQYLCMFLIQSEAGIKVTRIMRVIRASGLSLVALPSQQINTL
jgi:hypothetical protein